MERDEIRRQVKARIMEVMRTAKSAGMDAWKVAERTFPGTPTDVIAECWCNVEEEATEAWWEAVEKTVDLELAQRAIASAGKDA